MPNYQSAVSSHAPYSKRLKKINKILLLYVLVLRKQIERSQLLEEK